MPSPRIFPEGTRVRAVLFGEERTGTVVPGTVPWETGATFVLWDGRKAPTWQHTLSLSPSKE